MRTPRRLLSIAIVSILSAGLAPGAISQAGAAARSALRAHAASSFLTGIGDEHAQMFGNPLYQQLHTKIVRYIAPYDADDS